ncbi:MAG: hypothetical protein M3R36_11455 [Bacteroidota bacterium]|nr:hypothetical protein [Bacteroidota bacterium]
MSELIEPTSNKLEFFYKEYVRISDRCVSYVNSSFDDIKLYTVLGSIIAWPPITESFFNDDVKVLFLGFLAIYSVFIILSVYNLMKQSLVVYYLNKLTFYETEIRKLLNDEEKIFEWSESYTEWRKDKVVKIYSHLLIIVFLVQVVFPIIILFKTPCGYGYAWIYIGVSFLYTAIYLSAFKKIF